MKKDFLGVSKLGWIVWILIANWPFVLIMIVALIVIAMI